MASEVGAVPPPEQPLVIVFIRTSLETSLAMDALPTDSISDVKMKLRVCHLSTFPSHGEIVVRFLKLKHCGHFYCLSDSLLVRALNRGRGHLNLFAEVSACEMHLQGPAPLIRAQASVGGSEGTCSLEPHEHVVGDSSLPKEKEEHVPTKDSLPGVEDPIGKEKMIGDTSMIMDEETLDAGIGSRTGAQKDAIQGAETGDVSLGQIVAGDSEDATRENDVQGTKNASKGGRVEEPPKNASVTAEDVAVDSVGDKFLLKKRKKQVSETESSKKRDPVDSSADPKEPATTVLLGQVVNADAGSKGGPQKGAETGGEVAAEDVAVDSVGDKFLLKKRKKQVSGTESSKKRDPVDSSADPKEPATTVLLGQVVNADSGSKGGPQKGAETGGVVAAVDVAVDSVGDKFLSKKRKKQVSETKSSKKRDPVDSSADPKEPATTVLLGQVVNADAGSKGGPQKGAETGGEVAAEDFAVDSVGDKFLLKKRKKQVSESESTKKRHPVDSSADPKEPATTVLLGQVVNADAGSKGGPQKGAETGGEVAEPEQDSKKKRIVVVGLKRACTVAVATETDTRSNVIKENTIRKEVKVEKRKQRPSTLDQPSVAAENSAELNSPALLSTTGDTNLLAELGKHPEQRNITTRSRSLAVTSPSQKDEGNGRKSTIIPARK